MNFEVHRNLRTLCELYKPYEPYEPYEMYKPYECIVHRVKCLPMNRMNEACHAYAYVMAHVGTQDRRMTDCVGVFEYVVSHI